MDSVITTAKKTVVARLDEGEDLLLSLKKLADMYNIRCGWFSVFGGLREYAYGLYEEGEYREIRKKARHCIELLPTIGTITVKEGDVLIHSHVIAADEDEGVTSGGHLIEGSTVFPFAEVVMQECDAEIGRRYDKKTNLWPMAMPDGPGEKR